MAEHLKNSALPRAFANVVGDLADLLQKEIYLAKAELSEKFSAKLRAGVWIGVAAGLGAIASTVGHPRRRVRHRDVRHPAALVVPDRGSGNGGSRCRGLRQGQCRRQ